MKRLFALAALATTSAFGATFIVPTDATLVRASKAIVVATAGESTSRWAPGGWIETVTPMQIGEAIKGPVQAGETIEVVELGGEVGNIAYTVPGSPKYDAGESVLLFLDKNDRYEWASRDMVVGKFAFVRGLLERDATELTGWDEETGQPHREGHRDGERFLRYVRDSAAGRRANADYFVSDRRIAPEPDSRSECGCRLDVPAAARWKGIALEPLPDAGRVSEPRNAARRTQRRPDCAFSRPRSLDQRPEFEHRPSVRRHDADRAEWHWRHANGNGGWS